MSQIGQFQHPAPEHQLYNTPHEAMRRSQLFKLACDEGYVRADKPTPSKDQLLRILEEKVVVVDNDKLSPSDTPVLLSEAHKAQTPPPVLTQDDDDVFGTSGDDQALYNKYAGCNQVFTLMSWFKNDFPDVENEFAPGTKKKTILAAVREELGLEE